MKIDEIGNGKKEKFHEKKGKKVLTKTQTCINRGFAKNAKNTIYCIRKKYLALYLVDKKSWICYNEEDLVAVKESCWIFVTVHTYGANSNRIQPIYNSPSAKGWIHGCSTFLAHSFDSKCQACE